MCYYGCICMKEEVAPPTILSNYTCRMHNSMQLQLDSVYSRRHQILLSHPVPPLGRTTTELGVKARDSNCRTTTRHWYLLHCSFDGPALSDAFAARLTRPEPDCRELSSYFSSAILNLQDFVFVARSPLSEVHRLNLLLAHATTC